MSLHLRVRLPALLVLTSLAAACGGTTDDRTDEPQTKSIEIAGTWDDNYGGTTTISNSKWGTAAITKFNNTTRVAITQNAADAEYDPNKFNKNVWTKLESGTFYYCTVDYGKDTAADAENTTKTADANDLNGTGCGGFPWTKMVTSVEKIDLIGSWDDTYGFNTTITKDTWSGSAITKFDNTKRFAVIQNPSNAMYDPNKFNKNVWTVRKNGSFSFCTVDFGKDTAAAAENTTKTADETNLSTGCGGFPWTTVVAHSPIAVAGTWDEQFAQTPTTITATQWGASAVTTYNNATRTAIVQAPANDEWSPNKFSKFVWTPVESNVFFYCIVEYGKDTADDAANGTNVADPSNPATGGCGDFAWTKMTLKTNE